jgi:soluble lytic murein transglycosylase-like protein
MATGSIFYTIEDEIERGGIPSVRPPYPIAGYEQPMPDQYYEPDYEPIDTPWTPTAAREDPLNMRMILLLGVVGVIAFGLSYMAAALGRNYGGEVAELVPDAIAQSEAVAPPLAESAPVYSGGISPIFSAEIQHWAPKIVEWAGQHGLDPDMVATVMQIESCGDPQANSIAGAKGLFQVMPFHFSAGEDMLDPETNAARGVNYFAERMVQSNGDVGLALAGYNGGPGVMSRSFDTWPSETRRYYVWGSGIYQDAKSGGTVSSTLNEWLAAGGRSLCNQAAARLGLN